MYIKFKGQRLETYLITNVTSHSMNHFFACAMLYDKKTLPARWIALAN